MLIRTQVRLTIKMSELQQICDEIKERKEKSEAAEKEGNNVLVTAYQQQLVSLLEQKTIIMKVAASGEKLVAYVLRPST